MADEVQARQNLAIQAVQLAKHLVVLRNGVPHVDPTGIVEEMLNPLPMDGSELNETQSNAVFYQKSMVFQFSRQNRLYAQALRSVADAHEQIAALAAYYEAIAQRLDNTSAKINDIAAKGAEAKAKRLELEEASKPENMEKRIAALEAMLAEKNG